MPKTSTLTNSTFFLAVLVIISLRLPFIPQTFFNIDEATTAVMGDSILSNGIIYRDAVDHRGPLTNFVYALTFAIFGRNNMVAVHMVLTIIICFMGFALYRLTALLGLTARNRCWVVFFFAVFSYTYDMGDMLAFHTEWVAAMFTTLAMTWFLSYLVGHKKSLYLFAGGVCWGLAFFTKQPVLLEFFWAVVFGAIFIRKSQASAYSWIRPILTLLAGFLLVCFTFIIYFYAHNAFTDFWFYFWEYNQRYYVADMPSGERVVKAFKVILGLDESFLKTNWLLLVLFWTGWVGALEKFWRNGRRFDSKTLLSLYLLGIGCCSYIEAAYSGRNFGHYYIFLLPSFCLIAGMALQWVEERSIPVVRRLAIPLIILGIILPLVKYIYYEKAWEYYLGVKKGRSFVSQAVLEISTHIRNNTLSSQKILVWGFYPEFYVLADRDPASRYFNSNVLTGLIPWTNVDFKKDTSSAVVPGSWPIFMEELKNNMPAFIVDTSVGAENRYYIKSPPEKFPAFYNFLKTFYNVDFEAFSDKGPVFRLYKRKVVP